MPSTSELIIVRHDGSFVLGLRPVAPGGTVVFNRPTQLFFRDQTPFSSASGSDRYKVTGDPDRYWFGLDGVTYPYCIEVAEGGTPLEMVRFNLHDEGHKTTARVYLQLDAVPGRALHIVGENLESPGRGFQATLSSSGDGGPHEFHLETRKGTNIWLLDELPVGRYTMEIKDGHVTEDTHAGSGLGQVVGGEMGELEIGP